MPVSSGCGFHSFVIIIIAIIVITHYHYRNAFVMYRLHYTLGVIGVDSFLRCYVTPPLGIEAFHRVLLLDRWNTIPGLMLGPKHLARNDVTATRASTPLRAAYKATSATQRR